jgi:hypothetical protein
VVLPCQRKRAFLYSSDGREEDQDARARTLESLQRRVKVTSGSSQSDINGAGVVAASFIRKGELIGPDPSVFFVSRPPDYALAHLPQFHALEFGREGYFLLREPMLGVASLTYFVNEARHGGATSGPVANVAYKVMRPRGGGVSLGLLALDDIAEGGELLANYDQRLGL